MPEARLGRGAPHRVGAAPLAGGARVRGVRRIGVLRGGGLGDLIFALPTLEALHAAYPSAEVVLLGAAWAGPFLAGRPATADRVIALPPVLGVSVHPDLPGAREDHDARVAFSASMRLEAFDVILQINGGGRHSNPFVSGLGARLTAGLRAPDAPALDRWVRYVYYQSEVLRDLEVAGLVGAGPVRIEPRLPLLPRDRLAANAVLQPGDGPLAVLHPGAGDARRRWPADSFAAVGDALAERGARVVVTGTADEAPLTAGVAGAMRRPAIDLAGQLSLDALAGLLVASAVVVSNDSGPLHLAAAVGASTVGIYWCGNAINAGPASSARHRALLSWRLDCPVCGTDCTRARCPHQASFVADVPVRAAIEAARDVMEAQRSGLLRAAAAGRQGLTPRPPGTRPVHPRCKTPATSPAGAPGTA